MQNVAESPRFNESSERASILLSVKEHSDGTKFIIAICYQIATKFKTYREFFYAEVKHNPSILRSSVAKQFEKLIVKPFTSPELNFDDRILIIIDDLDQCEYRGSQLDLLISAFSITADPSSPLVWLIASRPELHIASFFPTFKAGIFYEEISVDSDDSCKDVKLFLRNQLAEIKIRSQLLDRLSNWPKERDLLALANASDGLFAYAYAVIQYIGNPLAEDATSKLRDVLEFIDGHPIPSGPQREHPMALLDALYVRILSDVPPEALERTQKLLLARYWNGTGSCTPTKAISLYCVIGWP
jgi:hypothetical protein